MSGPSYQDGHPLRRRFAQKPGVGDGSVFALTISWSSVSRLRRSWYSFSDSLTARWFRSCQTHRPCGRSSAPGYRLFLTRDGRFAAGHDALVSGASLPKPFPGPLDVGPRLAGVRVPTHPVWRPLCELGMPSFSAALRASAICSSIVGGVSGSSRAKRTVYVCRIRERYDAHRRDSGVRERREASRSLLGHDFTPVEYLMRPIGTTQDDARQAASSFLRFILGREVSCAHHAPSEPVGKARVVRHGSLSIEPQGRRRIMKFMSRPSIRRRACSSNVSVRTVFLPPSSVVVFIQRSIASSSIRCAQTVEDLSVDRPRMRGSRDRQPRRSGSCNALEAA